MLCVVCMCRSDGVGSAGNGKKKEKRDERPWRRWRDTRGVRKVALYLFGERKLRRLRKLGNILSCYFGWSLSGVELMYYGLQLQLIFYKTPNS